MTKAETAARKAVATRQARQTLRDYYGEATFEQVKLLSKGMTTWEVADETMDAVSSVAAVKANLTRGTYNWVGDLNF